MAIMSGKTYTILYYGDYIEPLLAIPDFYWGPTVWTSHISLLELNNMLPPVTMDSHEIKTKIGSTTYKKIEFIYNISNVKNVTLE